MVLILTRKVDEAVVIGDHIKVKVIQIRGKQVRLGIEAPPGLLILREGEKFLRGRRGAEPCLKQIHIHTFPSPKIPSRATSSDMTIIPEIFRGQVITAAPGKLLAILDQMPPFSNA